MLPNKKAINYCPMQYHNFLSQKFANILYNNINNKKISSKTHTSSIKIINYKLAFCEFNKFIF